MTKRTGIGVAMTTTSSVLEVTRLVASLHWRSVAGRMAGITVTCAMTSAAEMHAAGSRTSAESGSVMSRNYMT
jgi:hypothetical protein